MEKLSKQIFAYIRVLITQVFYELVLESSFYCYGRFQNHTKSGNLGKIVQFAIRTKPGMVLIEFVLSGDFLYMHSTKICEEIYRKYCYQDATGLIYFPEKETIQ